MVSKTSAAFFRDVTVEPGNGSSQFSSSPSASHKRRLFLPVEEVTVVFHKLSQQASAVGGRDAWSTSAPTKVCDLLKIWTKSLKIWAKSLKKTGKNGAQRLKKTFFGDHIKKCLHDLWRKKFVGKSRTKLFVQVCGNSGKNPSHLQNFASSYTYATSKSIEIQEVSMFREI